jgi:hypothetical protein
VGKGWSRGGRGLFRCCADVLQVRFGEVPSGLLEVLGQVQDLARLTELHRRAVGCTSLEEFASEV